MIVIGTDVHKHTHCCAAVEATTSRLLEGHQAPSRTPGFRALLEWARGLGEECVWAIEDCRHVPGGLERRAGTGNTRTEAIRALKRRLSDVVYRALVEDENTARARGELVGVDSVTLAVQISTGHAAAA